VIDCCLEKMELRMIYMSATVDNIIVYIYCGAS